MLTRNSSRFKDGGNRVTKLVKKFETVQNLKYETQFILSKALAYIRESEKKRMEKARQKLH